MNDKSLQTLDLRDETLGSSSSGDDSTEKNGMFILCNALRDSYYLLDLNLSGNLIDDTDCKHVGSALLTNEGLTSLNLSYNKIGDIGCAEVAAALKLHKLSFLDLSYNSIMPAGGTSLGEMLRSNTTLITLNLGNNNIGDTGGHDLFDSLTTPLYETEEVMMAKARVYEQGGSIDDIGEVFNTTLTSLNVSCNDLGQTAAERLTQVLSANVVLTRLNLDYNPKLGNTEVRNIASAIKTYEPSIEVLNFSENGVGNDVAGAFARFLGLPGCIVKKLTLAHNCLRSTGVGRIAGET